ncbi:hypothetical protein ACFO9Q_02190 [Paenibacillus sp. GCM10023252]|uniref:lipase family protein n=1 Tax=Paenibacillus sp. GCM10023252 TaxID=3252649 RepID=UPI0036236528
MRTTAESANRGSEGSGRILDIYLLSGVATMPGFFLSLEQALLARCREEGWDAAIYRMDPYGDHTRRVWRQVPEVYGDFSFRSGVHGPRAEAVVHAIQSSYRGGGLLLIGHSGGGVAAYLAAAKLLDAGAAPDCRIIQIGSPRVRISPELQAAVTHLAAADNTGKRKDPITRLGSWGGPVRGRGGLWTWNQLKHAPQDRLVVPLIGGHADYFRSRPPYIHRDESSNLDRTLGAFWPGVKDYMGLRWR